MVDPQDVVIVGAGPAGCVLSILLARSGVRVTLVERQTVFDREFRGPAYQPSAVRIFDEMGILDEILEIEHAKVDSFAFEKRGKKVFEARFDDLPPPYNYILVLRQAPLLRRLVEIAGQYPNFTYLGGTEVEGLLQEREATVGIRSTVGEIRARLVVAADGRFSKLRAEAGIEVDERPQAFDVLWFEAPAPEGAPFDVGFHIASTGLLVTIPKEEGKLQIGWILEKGSYAALRSKGLDHFRDQLAAVDPSLSGYLTSWDQCSLLDVKMSVAQEWAKEGLLLIGDAAHVASPMGALGNKLAIEDAALVHPLITAALGEGKGPLQLTHFQKSRQPDIETNLRIQRKIAWLALSWRRIFAPLARPLIKRVRHQVALSPTPVHVDRRPFRDPERRYHLLRVRAIRQETPLAKSFVFEIPPYLGNRFSYWAGQFLTFRVLRQGRLLKRCYSMSSCPVADAYPQITVKKIEDGLVSSHLHDQIKEGDKLLVLPPAGLFIMPDASPHHYLFVAGGSGITPCMSLICTILQESPKSRISMLYVNRDAPNIIFKEKLDKFGDRFEVTHWLTSEKGRPSVEDLEAFFEKGTDAAEIYLCGPAGLMGRAREAIRLPAGHVHEERFLSAIGHQEEPLVVQEPLEVGDGVPGVPETIKIQLDDRIEQVPYTEGETLLDAALRAGLPAPFSCQEGICATCRARLVEGKVVMDKHEALSKDEANDSLVLTCRAKALSQQCSVRFE
jgi:2-polyprenyl-6-methoxyphenol hydroxylase-like FAD-dependent oxidoreductase/ferredoxin-NADP reductase